VDEHFNVVAIGGIHDIAFRHATAFRRGCRVTEAVPIDIGIARDIQVLVPHVVAVVVQVVADLGGTREAGLVRIRTVATVDHVVITRRHTVIDRCLIHTEAIAIGVQIPGLDGQAIVGIAITVVVQAVTGLD
jgi:hypothetical protein